MKKPLWRWTVGDVHWHGLEGLADAVDRTQRALGKDAWDWVFCCNSLPPDKATFIQILADSYDVRVVDAHQHIPSFIIGRTAWKMAPPRLAFDRHEVHADNDIIICRRIPEIDRWLARTDLTLVLQERLRAFGRYDDCLPPEVTANGGLFGLPPYWDFEAALKDHLKGPVYHMPDDEQGLCVATLWSIRHIVIPAKRIIMVHHNGLYHTKDLPKQKVDYHFTGTEYGFHFGQLNTGTHSYWPRYKAWRAGLA